MDSEEFVVFGNVYSAWLGTPVLLFVIRECRIPIPCSIVGESITDVRIRLEAGWEFDIPKELILAVEEAATTLRACMN
jgi:hypothetical protein